MSTAPVLEPASRLAAELGLPRAGVEATLSLLGAGNTVPFIARYRKEATGSLDEVQLRSIAERHAYLVELDLRRRAILESIEQQGKLAPELRAQILAAETKAALEDLYLPFKPKRRTRASLARERGLEPLAERILDQPHDADPPAEAAGFVNAEAGVADALAALAGARDIAAERVAERADVRALVRGLFASRGRLQVEVTPAKRAEPTKFQQYYDHSEPVASIPSHRYLAVSRGEREEVLRVRVELDRPPVETILGMAGFDRASPFAAELRLAVEDGYDRLIVPSVVNDLRAQLKERSDLEAVEVFAANLKDLLLASPLGPEPVIGVDPGLRTGCKVASVDSTGALKAFTTLYLSRSEAEREQARQQILSLIERHRPAALAVGNGTGGREAEAFLRAALEQGSGQAAPKPVVVQVSEAGASVYSASDLARRELPDHDVVVRGAVSIARRLQDPLAELVKIEPRAIGVGQYQHDVHQPLLVRKLDEVVEDCVNRVGVELNTGSGPLLARVAGIGPKLADRIVAHREAHGAFASRRKLLDVAGLGPKTFEQAAGFLRIRAGVHPLDASAVHPERYDLVERMAADLGVGLAELIGDPGAVGRIQIDRYTSDDVGEPTLKDILTELAKPGRDPRKAFEPVHFREDVRTVDDLEPGMRLEGVVTNVTKFGAFVDVGVHRDGLVHISELSDEFVRDPREKVKVGDRIEVRVLEVDLERKRISLSARSQADARPGRRGDGDRPVGGPGRPKAAGRKRQPHKRAAARTAPPAQAAPGGLTHNPFADLLKKR